MTGEDLIRYICGILDKKDIRAYDSSIVMELRALTSAKLREIVKNG